MRSNIPEHFSHDFELKIADVPTRATDRLQLKILLPGLFFGAILFVLGLFEILNGFNQSEAIFSGVLLETSAAPYAPFLNATVFDVVIMIIGLWIVSALILTNIRYKKIFYDGKNVTIIHRPAIGDKVTIRENIKNYDGVMLRIEFFQFGIINRNKYVIELAHKNPEKIAPLYISTSGKNIRGIWENYAKTLNLPTLINTDEGIVKREVKDLDKSLREMAKIWDLKKNFNENSRPSYHLAYAKKKDKIIIKSRKIIWDAYNILAWMFILFLGLVTLAVCLNHQAISLTSLTIFYIIMAFVLLISVLVLFRKDKLIIKKDKFVHTHKYMLFSTKHNEMNKDDVESVDVALNPVTGRYSVAITSDHNTIIFGKKLPINDLKWVKKFLINDIIKDE